MALSAALFVGSTPLNNFIPETFSVVEAISHSNSELSPGYAAKSMSRQPHIPLVLSFSTYKESQDKCSGLDTSTSQQH